jgi:hypothetical protein
VLTTAPAPCAIITGSTCRSPRKTPFTFTAITASNIASSWSTRGRTWPSMPALLKKQWMQPQAAIAAAT